MSTTVNESSILKAATGTWVIDPAHTNLGFTARHAMVTKVRGGFGEFAGQFTIAEDLSESTAELTIQAESIFTGNADRDAHVKSADFLDVENYPTLDFVFTSARVEGDVIIVSGDLTIRGVTRPVQVAYEFTGVSQDPWGATKIGFEGTAKISRKDFGLVWNVALEAGGVLVSDEIKLTLDVQASKQA